MVDVDICRICKLHINKKVLIQLFSIEVQLSYESDLSKQKESNYPIMPSRMQIPVYSCECCVNNTDDFVKSIRNADITLKAVFQDKNLVSDAIKFDPSEWAIPPFENNVESGHENHDEDYKPSKSSIKQAKKRKNDKRKTVIVLETSMQTRSSSKKFAVDNTQKQEGNIENKNDAISISNNINEELVIEMGNEDNSSNFNEVFSFDDLEESDDDDVNQINSNFCNYCDENVDDYKEHKKKFHNRKRHPFSCIVCRASYPTAYELYKHQFNMHRPYVGGACDICNEHYTNLVHHNWKRHQGELCFQCGKTFPSKRQFSNHIITHHTGVKHFCHICNKGFKKPNHLRNHLELHDENCKVKCSTCDKHFFGKQRLKIHEKTHTVERKSTKSDALETITTEKHSFKCPFCTLSFICLESLQKHSTYHRVEEKNTEIYKHVCQYCSQRFKRSDHKQIHEDAVHRKILPFKCETCGLKFVKQNFLTYHIKKTHSGVKFQCNMCPKSFTLASTLKRHEKNLHFDLAKCNCSVCGKEMKNTRYLLVHLKTHTYEEEKQAADRFYEELLSKQKANIKQQAENSMEFS